MTPKTRTSNPLRPTLMTCEETIDHIVNEAEAVGMEVIRKRDHLEVETLDRIAEVDFRLKEWAEVPSERFVRLELAFCPDQQLAPLTGRRNFPDFSLARLDVTAAFNIVAPPTRPDEIEEHLRRYLQTLKETVASASHWFTYSVNSDPCGRAMAGGAWVTAALDLTMFKEWFRDTPLIHVANCLRTMGPACRWDWPSERKVPALRADDLGE